MSPLDLKSYIRDVPGFLRPGVLFRRRPPAATGGTAAAAAKLVERLGARVRAIAFLVELGYLGGRDRLGGYEVLAFVRYKAA